MADPSTPQGLEPPSGSRLLKSTLIAAVIAILVLVLFILPAEYGIDPTGIGRATGISQLNQPTRTIEVVDVVGGNESVLQAEIPAFGDPVPLPNPAVFQEAEGPARTQTFEVMIPPEGETEIKAVLEEARVILFSWQVDRGTIYSDFHGHTPEAGAEFFVRYKEHQEGSGDYGSLVAPFAGEHGWYWLNYNEYPVTVSLSITGFFEDTIDYGIF